MDEICIRMKELRKDFCLSQVEFAERLGITNAHISKIEKGKTVPSDALIKLICKEFNVNELWLKKGATPIYNDEIEIDTEKSLSSSSEKFNKLLRTDSVLIRAQAAQLSMLFSEITNIEGVNDDDKLLYLKMCEKLLYDINKVLSVFKKNAFDNQLSFLSPEDLSVVFNDGFKAVFEDLKSFESFYIKGKGS